jgi:glycosyltransferase involved in cell wall biosynthesis
MSNRRPMSASRSAKAAASAADRGIILVAANSCWNLVNFRSPVIRELIDNGYRVVASAPLDDAAPALRALGVAIDPIAIDARGVSPLNDFKLLLDYRSCIRRIAPKAFLGFTAKPNIYGSAAAASLGVPAINTVTGLGTGFLSGRILHGIVARLYRWGLRRSHKVLFHNQEDLDLFVRARLVRTDQAGVVAGSGIDLERFTPAPKKGGEEPLTFLFIGRFLKDKGLGEFLEAASLVRQQRLAQFQIIGAIEDHPKAVSRQSVEQAAAAGTVELLGRTDDVRPFIANADCIVLPSYREGLPRVLLEAGAMATPVIAADVPGCRQAVEHGVTGLLCEARSAADLAQAMLTIAEMAAKDRLVMGERGRTKAEREFSEQRVVAAYLEAVAGIDG